MKREQKLLMVRQMGKTIDGEENGEKKCKGEGKMEMICRGGAK